MAKDEKNEVVTTLRLPVDLRAKVVKMAEQDRRSFNTQVVLILEKAVAK